MAGQHITPPEGDFHLKLDTHVHTINEKPDPTMNQQQLLAMAKANDLDGFIVTEHNVIRRPADLQALKQDALDNYGLHVFQGVEIGCSDGFHYLVYGHLDFFPLPEDISPQELVVTAHRHNCWVAIAHPFRKPDVVLPGHVYRLNLDGVEVKSYNLQSKLAQEKSRQMAVRMNCAVQAGTDHHAHCPRIGRIGIELAHPVTSEEELVAALRSESFQCFATVDF